MDLDRRSRQAEAYLVGRLATIVLCAIVAEGCQSEPYGHVVANHTRQTIEVIEQVDSTELDLGHVSPGLELPLNFHFGLQQCSRGTLIARQGDKTGPEIARRIDPLCYNDRWVISDGESSVRMKPSLLV